MKNFALSLAATVSALALATTANAATIWTFAGNSAADGPVSASATIDVTAGGLTVDLTNLFSNQTSSGQSLSGIQFFFDTLPTGASLTSASGTEININKQKKGPNTTSGSDNVIGHWGTALSGGSLFLATAGTGALGGQPFDLILGSGPYSNANSSITNRNPHIQETGHFVLTFTGLTTAPKLTGVNLGFGTSADYHSASCISGCTPPPPTVVPEPATWAMMIIGFGGVGAMVRRRRLAVA